MEYIRVGIDANILIDMILKPEFKSDVLGLGFMQDKHLCTSKRAYLEAVGILKHAYGHINANKETLILVRQLRIEVLSEANEDTGAALNYLREHELDGREWRDMMILATLKRNKATHLLTRDKKFREVAEKEGLIAIIT